MTSDSYKHALDDAKAALANAVQQRAVWTKEVARLEQLVKSLAVMVVRSQQQDKVADIVGLQELVFSCVCGSPEPITAVEIRDALVNIGYDIGRYKNPLAVIHSALARLRDAGQIFDLGNGKYAVSVIMRPRPRRKV